MIEEDPEVIAKASAEMRAMTEASKPDYEKLADWMIDHGFPTGHGDNMEGLLKELTWQVKELKDRRKVS